MTEAEWYAATDPTPMLELLRGKVSDRKLRLFACAAVSYLRAGVISEGNDAIIESLQRVADTGILDLHQEGLTEITCPLVGRVYLHPHPNSPPYVMIGSMIRPSSVICLVEAMKVWNEIPSGEHAIVFDVVPSNATVVQYSDLLIRLIPLPPLDETPALQASLAALLRNIFGNPFRSVVFDPSWRTPTVIALAKEIYEKRDFSSMPILADTLQDAECSNDEILNHLRGDRPHCRGCWTVDLVLGKE